MNVLRTIDTRFTSGPFEQLEFYSTKLQQGPPDSQDPLVSKPSTEQACLLASVLDSFKPCSIFLPLHAQEQYRHRQPLPCYTEIQHSHHAGGCGSASCVVPQGGGDSLTSQDSPHLHTSYRYMTTETTLKQAKIHCACHQSKYSISGMGLVRLLQS